MATIKARFVGGDWHNRLIECEALPVIRCPVRTEAAFVPHDGGPTWHEFKAESYYLCRFYTEHRTIYTQYVHESLMRGSEPQSDSFCEDEFAPMPERLFKMFVGKLVTSCRS